MSRLLLIAGLCLLVLPLHAQTSERSHCLPKLEYTPTLIENADRLVTFQCDAATPLDVIRAVGYETRIPFGVILGGDVDKLSSVTRSFNLDGVLARDAILKALEGTGYSLDDKGPVWKIRTKDLSVQQKKLLQRQYSDFTFPDNETMVYYGIMLEVRIRMDAMSPKSGYGGSIPTSANEEHYRLTLPHPATIEEIADQIVSHGPKGMWVWKVGVSTPSGEPDDEMEVDSYQHYSNEVPSGSAR